MATLRFQRWACASCTNPIKSSVNGCYHCKRLWMSLLDLYIISQKWSLMATSGLLDHKTSKYIPAVIVYLLWLGCLLYPVGGDYLLTPMLLFRLWVWQLTWPQGPWESEQGDLPCMSMMARYRSQASLLSWKCGIFFGTIFPKNVSHLFMLTHNEINSSSRDNAGQVFNDGDGGNPMRFMWTSLQLHLHSLFTVFMIASMQYSLADAQLSQVVSCNTECLCTLGYASTQYLADTGAEAGIGSG